MTDDHEVSAMTSLHNTDHLNKVLSPEELERLNGKSVLVKSSRDHRDPPAVYRGTVEILDRVGDQDGPTVAIAVTPQSDVAPARPQTIILDSASLARLVATKGDDLPEITVNEPIRSQAGEDGR